MSEELIALLDFTLMPCWPRTVAEKPEPWAGKVAVAISSPVTSAFPCAGPFCCCCGCAGFESLFERLLVASAASDEEGRKSVTCGAVVTRVSRR